MGYIVFGNERCISEVCKTYVNPWALAWAAGHCIIYAFYLKVSEWMRLVALAVCEVMATLWAIGLLIVFVNWVAG